MEKVQLYKCFVGMRGRRGGVSSVKCGDCLEVVCFVGLMVERICVWSHSCHIYGIWANRRKKVWGCLKVINWGWRCKSQKGGTLFIGKAGSHYVILLSCETLYQVLLGIYGKRFYWIPLFTILLLFYMFEVGKVKSATQIVLMILTLNGLFQKVF